MLERVHANCIARQQPASSSSSPLALDSAGTPSTVLRAETGHGVDVTTRPHAQPIAGLPVTPRNVA